MMKKCLISFVSLCFCLVAAAEQTYSSDYSSQPFIDMQSAQEAFVGQKFIDFAEKDGNGKKHKLSEYVGKGNYILIDFWASWCGPCMMEMPVLKHAKSQYAKYGFDIVGVSLDNNETQWKTAIKNGGLNWVHLSGLSGWDTPVLRLYNISAIPSNFLCNGEGVIVAVNLRGMQLLEKLKEIYETM